MTSNAWTYQKKVVTDAMVPVGSIGFIYLMTQVSTGKFYIGRKLLTKSGSKQVNGKKKKVRTSSDWKEYWSSSPKIKTWISEAGGTDDFTREILVWCYSRGSISYCEELALYSVGALETDKFINDNIRSKIYRSWVKINDANELRRVLKKKKLTV